MSFTPMASNNATPVLAKGSTYPHGGGTRRDDRAQEGGYRPFKLNRGRMRNMYSAVGIFSTWEAAQQAAKSLAMPEDQVSVIAPGRREPEETGIGAPLGGAVGGALGPRQDLPWEQWQQA